MLKVLVHIYVPRVSVFSGCCSHYIIHLNFLLPVNELFFLLLRLYCLICESTEPMVFDRVNWIDVKIIFLQSSSSLHVIHPVLVVQEMCGLLGDGRRLYSGSSASGA